MRYVRHVHVPVPCNTINQVTVFIFILFFRLCVLSTMETISLKQKYLALYRIPFPTGKGMR